MSTQPEPSVAAARSSRSRSRSRSVAKTESLVDIEVEETATIDVPELLQTPQIAPGIRDRDYRFVAALNEQETRQLMRRQSLRIWWHMRGRKINSGGLD